MKNRYIGFNIRQIQDIVDHAEFFNNEGALLFIDFPKPLTHWNGHLCMKNSRNLAFQIIL